MPSTGVHQSMSEVTKMDLKNKENKGRSNLTIQMLLYIQFASSMNMAIIPVTALNHGAFGFILMLIFFYVFLGIPLTYMESVVSQFTERDGIDVWKIRGLLSHIGYIVCGIQILILVCNHVLTSFTLHYFLITFESNIPYSICGPWSDRDCNILANNYTVNEDCVQLKGIYNYCDYIYRSYPEYQYFRYHLLHYKMTSFFLAWRVCLASVVICILMYLMCFKRETSLKYALPLICVIPMIGLLFFLMGSMQQKGVLTMFVSVSDSNFQMFYKNFRLSHLIAIVIHNLAIGSGLTFNLSSRFPFRTSCFSNSVICVCTCSLFSVLAVINVIMVCCPYSHKFQASATDILKSQLLLTFDRYPMFLNLYSNKRLYLVLVYSIMVVLGIGSNIAIFFNILETLFKRYEKIAAYPGLTCAFGCVLLFLTSIPLLSAFGVLQLTLHFRRHYILIGTFIALVECMVFVIWYGPNRYSEDIHFMLGIKPNLFMKFTWVAANGFLCYAFLVELNYQNNNYSKVGCAFYFNVTVSLLIVLGIIVQIIKAMYNKKLPKAFALDLQWGPKSELLQRSRGMFSAQAMTKEYMYRQYHLQAGIVEREKRSNVRVQKL